MREQKKRTEQGDEREREMVVRLWHLTLRIRLQEAVPWRSLIRVFPCCDVGIGVDVVISTASAQQNVSQNSGQNVI
jgi:hypothetical protein